MALSEAGRLREEDPFTAQWTGVAETQITALRSRFEVDLNRPRETAVYLKPEDAWGLEVWKTGPSPEIVARSMAEYNAFYSEVRSFSPGLNTATGGLSFSTCILITTFVRGRRAPRLTRR